MRHFTPQRYLQLGNLSDEKAFRAAHDDWEGAVQGYQDHLRQIREELPAGLRQLIESVYLHDARVLDMWPGRRSRFTITLQPESDPSHLVILVYSLEEPAAIIQDVLPASVRSEPVAWLYDELNVERPGNGAGGSAGRQPVLYTHDILLSNGWEVRLRFRSVTVSRPVSLIPTTDRTSAAQAAVSRSA
jgi:hypothetical protein